MPTSQQRKLRVRYLPLLLWSGGMINSEAQLLHTALQRFEDFVVHQKLENRYAHVCGLAEELMASLFENFDFAECGGGGASPLVSLRLQASRAKRVMRVTKRKLEKSKAAQENVLELRVHARIQHIWFVRVGLARPTVPILVALIAVIGVWSEG